MSEASKIAYKLFRLRADGSLGPLFINRSQRVPVGLWVDAENHPTKGYALRPGWHCAAEPVAPHLKQSSERVWARCEIADFYPFTRPAHQGGEWLIAQRLKVLEVLS
jgi:hypothetical protein